MTEIILILLIVLTTAVLVFLLTIYKKISKNKGSEAKEEFERLDRTLRDEFARSREETTKAGKSQREELSGAIKLFSEQLFNLFLNVSCSCAVLLVGKQPFLEHLRGSVMLFHR